VSFLDPSLNARAMDDAERRDEIVDLEARIEQLARAIESCAKFILLSRIAIAVGGMLLLVTVFGAIRFDPMVMIVAIAAMLGGVVLLGSNRTTSDQAAAALEAAELRRAELIGTIDLHVVGNGHDRS
jgi:hypothetical protein